MTLWPTFFIVASNMEKLTQRGESYAGPPYNACDIPFFERQKTFMPTQDQIKPQPASLGIALQRAFMKLHVSLYQRTGGAIGGRLAGRPMLLLTTIGRKSQQKRLWSLITAKYKNFQDYQDHTTREIPVVILTPEV